MKKLEMPIEAQNYNREYFLTDCDGYINFCNHKGRELPERLKGFYERLVFYPEDRVLEIGCGRGELCYAIAPRVRSIIGIDYSEAAIEICQETYKDSGNVKFRLADAKELPFQDNSFDLVHCSEIIEHLHNWEVERMMSEVARVLDVNGRFIAQTEPNKMYRWVSSIWSYRQRALQAKQEGSKVRFMIEPPPSHVLLHVNEQTYWSLKRLVRKYFQEYKVATYELALGMDDSLRRTYNAYPYNNLPLLRLFFNRELIAYSKRPRPKRPNYK